MIILVVQTVSLDNSLAKRLGQQLYYDGFFMGAFHEAERVFGLQ